MDNSMTTMDTGQVGGAGRSRRAAISVVCLTALGLGALVATGPVEAAPALLATTTPPPPTPNPVTTVEQLRTAIANNGGVINIAPGTYSLTSQLEIRRNGTQLRAVDPTNTTLAYTGGASTSKSRVLEVWATGVVVDGLKITGGNNPTDDGGGGVEVESGASLTLSRSWVTGNVDGYGGGVFNEGTLTLVDSTISGNTATVKGGGLLNDRTATVTNSTIEGNRAPLGAGITSFSTISVVHSTIVRNVNSSTSTSSSSVAGLQQYGGTFNVRYSIVGDNLLSNGNAARNCGGTVNLRDTNLVSSTTGCTTPTGNPTPLVPDVPGSPLVELLNNNGGPTPTAAPRPGSKAINAYVLSGACFSGIAADQRGTARPSGGKCDLGSFESAPLDVTAALSVDTSNYPEYIGKTEFPGPTVEVGATTIPTNRIASELASSTTANDDGTLNSAPLRSIALRSIALRSITLADIPLRSISPEGTALRSIELKANALRSIPLRSIPLRSIALRSIPLRSIALRSIPLRSIPLRSIGGWEEVLKNSEFAGVPLQSITLEDIEGEIPEDFTLESIDLSGTPLRSISLSSTLLTGTPLRSIQPAEDSIADGEYAAEWCTILFSAQECGEEAVGAVGEAELWEAQLSGGNVDQPSVLEVPLSGLTAAPLRSIPLRSIPLRSIFLENTPLRSIPLRSIALRSINGVTLNSILTCVPNGTGTDACPSNVQTLGDAVQGCLPTGVPVDPTLTCYLDPNATTGQLLDLLGGDNDDPGVPDETNLLTGLTLFDILFAFVPPEDIPWEAVDLQSASLQNLADPDDRQPTFDYLTTVTVANGPTDIDVEVVLPPGFVLADEADQEPATWCPGVDACDTPANAGEGANPAYSIDNVQTGIYTLRVPVRAGTKVSDVNSATVRVAATGLADPIDDLTVNVTVVQDGAGSPATAPILSEGDLQLGYIGGSGELDVYSLDTTGVPAGSSARVLLSNIPDGVDYDLTVYGPSPTSLRGTPRPELPSLGDVGFDLDPNDDALATDVVNDIAIDINDVAAGIGGLNLQGTYALRDVSSRRSNNDEEVTLPTLLTNTKYVVVVSGYFGDLSPEPYGLRVRLDTRTALPDCAVTDLNPAVDGIQGYPNHSLTAPPVPPDLVVGPQTNTLYVTNSARLDAESPGKVDQVIASIEGTRGFNGVVPGLLLVDGISEWDNWNSDSCSPDARNAVVKAIGNAIDAANQTVGGTIENIVIVGGDGVIPMAAVPDLTEYSNESTFAGEVLSADGLTNAVSGTIGNGYLLSDDPYATDAGISVLGGDHELYVPDRNIGRLVETADEIIGQLDNFAEYGGQLDPETFTNQAAVTGYDFLDDGAQAIAAALSVEYLITPLFGPGWNKTSFLAAFSGQDYSVYSPNAHYDFESLLPAAEDAAGYFTDDQLVDTSDFFDVAPVAALGFTVGCHAGLSVSDVQLGLPSLDWAQLAAGNSTQWIGHTTYGYGDTEIVAYSERLAELFAGNVAEITAAETAGKTSLGAAVRDAKQRYLAGTLVLTPYDEKILQSWTYYGLPMYTIGDDVPAARMSESLVAEENPDDTTTTTTTTESTTTTSSPQPLVAGIMRAGALMAASVVGPVTFGDPVGSRVPVSIDLRGGRLARTDVGADGSYYSVDGNTTVAQYRPVQPLVDVAIPGAASGAFGGFLITGLTSDDLPSNYVPFYSRPLVDNSVDEGRVTAEDGAFPASLQRIADLGNGQRLLVAAGQYQGGQRLFRQISGELLPRTNAEDTDAPRFLDVAGANVPGGTGASGRIFQFDVTTDEDATEVVIVYREEGRPNWNSIRLSQVAGDAKVWSGSAPLVSANPATKAEFFAQSVDAAGNVGLTSNKIENFLAVDESLVPPVTGEAPTIVPGTKNQVDGEFFETGATFTIEPDTATVEVDGVPIDDYDPTKPITVTYIAGSEEPSYNPVDGKLFLGSGSHTIVATNAETPVTQTFVVDPDGPNVTFSDTGVWTQGPVTLSVTADDGLGSGMEDLCVDGDCSATETEGVFEAELTIGAGAGEVLEQDVEATATDRLGNQTVTSTTVRIDRAEPTATLSVNPDADDDGIYKAGETATVTFSCDDVGSGVESCALFDGSTELTGDSPYTIPTEGRKNLTVRATDIAGNTYTTPEIQIEIDLTAPTASLSVSPDADADGIYMAGETATVTFTCDDDGSDIATCALFDGLTELTGDSPYDLTSVGQVDLSVTAIDNAGNTFTSSTTSITIDPVRPVVTITKSPAREWWNDDVTVTVTATDDGGSTIDTVCVQVDNGTCDPVPLNQTGTYETTVDTDGTKVFTVNATDKAGNAAVPKSTTVNIDTVNPTASLSVTADANGDGIYNFGETATATFSCGDVGSGVAACELLDGGTVVATASGSPYTINTSTTGTKTLTVRATDAAGNTFTSPAKTLTIGFKTCVLSTSSQSLLLPVYTMRLQLCDENGVNRSASNITLTALAIDGTRDPIFNFSGLPLNYRFKYVSSGKYYEYTFYTGGLARNVDHTLSFTTQPVPSRAIGVVELNKLATNTATFRLR